MSNKTDNAKQQFYQTFFKTTDGYEEKEVNGFWLIRQWDGNNENWVIHLYSPQSYHNYKTANSKFSLVSSLKFAERYQYKFFPND